MKLSLREFLRSGALGNVQTGADHKRAHSAGISEEGTTWLRFVGTGDKTVVDLRLVIDAGDASTEEALLAAKARLREILPTLTID